MSPYFQNIRDNRHLESKYEGSALRKRAKAIQAQDDADAATVEVHADAETRKGFNQHAFDFLSPAKFWRNLSLAAALAVAGVAGYAIYKDGNLEGVTLYAAVALAVSSIVALPFFLKQRHGARAVADRFPATIVDDHVTNAHRFVKTFGEVMPKTFSSLALAFGAGLDGFLAGWVMLGALTGLPVFAQVAAAALVTVVFVALIDALGKAFAGQLGKIRARDAVRVKESALRKDAKHADEVAYLRQQYSAKYTGGFRANRWTDYALALLPLLTMIVFFALVVWVRTLVPPSANAISMDVLIGLSILCCAIAIAGAVTSSTAHPLPETGIVESAIARRFPTVQSFQVWQAANDSAIERWANKVAKEIESDCHLDDFETARAQVTLALPFPSKEAETAGKPETAASPTHSTASPVTPATATATATGNATRPSAGSQGAASAPGNFNPNLGGAQPAAAE